MFRRKFELKYNEIFGLIFNIWWKHKLLVMTLRSITTGQLCDGYDFLCYIAHSVILATPAEQCV